MYAAIESVVHENRELVALRNGGHEDGNVAMTIHRRNTQPSHSTLTIIGASVIGFVVLSACAITPTEISSQETDTNLLDPPKAAATFPPLWTPTHTQPPASSPNESLSPALETSQPLGLDSLVPVEIVTAVPRSGDYAGWQQVDTNLATFWLPGSFEIIDLGDGFGELFSAFFEGVAEGLGELAEELSAEPR